MHDRLNKILKDKNIEIKELANKMGKSYSYVHGLTNGKNSIGLRVIESILKIFPDVNARWFIIGHGEIYSNYSDIEEKIESIIAENIKLKQDNDRKDKIIDIQAEYIESLNLKESKKTGKGAAG